ncbi:endo alpha-1,4 polygalactosaminidase [Microbulbifer yueqingensis]|uniref:Glycoside-hydrolase family GH114 TIM-barrel domain-containing protein n=1 Tax=Microbulbifer yueqingensis TaxID=658219 RepID=A0A1G8ZIZ4_9GAMM|nr:endo alpha-1,4 polygalactosaminidase [Microbulbifer yueqingensis]SDK14574.1 cysteinyl-tRNA synthetase, unknown class [Microbulbifer yueqingensis]
MNRYLALLLAPLLLVACEFDDLPELTFQREVRDFRADMRELVRDIAIYARERRENFIVVPQDGVELVTTDGLATGALEIEYLDAVDGLGAQGVFFGAAGVDQPTPITQTDRLIELIDLAVETGEFPVLVTDFANSRRNIDEAYDSIAEAGFLPFVAPNRELDTVPGFPLEVPGTNFADIDDLGLARNFLNLVNPRLFSTRQEFIDALVLTDYDVLILDFFFNGEPFTAAQLQQLRFKPGGGRRLLLAYLSIGQAESDRFYWQNSWFSNPPVWLVEQVAGDPTNYHVRYWEPGWQAILFGSPDAYLDRILDTAFDGVFLDHVDEYEFFERN